MFKRRKTLYIICQGEFIKVGIAFNVWKRLAELQTGNPHSLYIYATFEEMGYYEGLCHERLINDRVGSVFGGREWFYYTENTESLIKELVNIANRDKHKYTIDNRFVPKKGKS